MRPRHKKRPVQCRERGHPSSSRWLATWALASDATGAPEREARMARKSVCLVTGERSHAGLTSYILSSLARPPPSSFLLFSSRSPPLLCSSSYSAAAGTAAASTFAPPAAGAPFAPRLTAIVVRRCLGARRSSQLANGPQGRPRQGQGRRRQRRQEEEGRERYIHICARAVLLKLLTLAKRLLLLRCMYAHAAASRALAINTAQSGSLFLTTLTSIAVAPA